MLGREIKNIAFYEGEWPATALTERHALLQMCELMPASQTNRVYLGFPWSRLIDLSEKNTVEYRALLAHLEKLKEQFAGKNVVTVCQHENMLNHQALFNRLGIDDIFWPYTTDTTPVLPEYRNTKLHPFPLHIKLLLETTGVVSQAYKDNSGKVVFSQCDLEPKLERLWGCMREGIIPIVVEGNHRLPGNKDLWREAVIFTDKHLILELPHKIQPLIEDEAFLNKKRKAISQLLLLYGPDCFVYDILMLLIKNNTEERGSAFSLTLHELSFCESKEQEGFYIICCLSRLHINSEQFQEELESSCQAYSALGECVSKKGLLNDLLRKTLKHKNILVNKQKKKILE